MKEKEGKVKGGDVQTHAPFASSAICCNMRCLVQEVYFTASNLKRNVKESSDRERVRIILVSCACSVCVCTTSGTSVQERAHLLRCNTCGHKQPSTKCCCSKLDHRIGDKRPVTAANIPAARMHRCLVGCAEQLCTAERKDARTIQNLIR